MNGFQKWWVDEGSAMRPLPNEDAEEFAKRIAGIAWANGAYCTLASPEATRAAAQINFITNLSRRDA